MQKKEDDRIVQRDMKIHSQQGQKNSGKQERKRITMHIVCTIEAFEHSYFTQSNEMAARKERIGDSTVVYPIVDPLTAVK